MEKKLTLKEIYNIAYNNEEPFTNDKSLTDFYFTTFISSLVENEMSPKSKVGFVDFYCYFLDKLNLDIQDVYEHLLKNFNDTNADVFLYEIYNKDELFEGCKLNNYILEKLGVNLKYCDDEKVPFNANLAVLMIGDKILKSIAENIEQDVFDLDYKKGFLKLVHIIYDENSNKSVSEKLRELVNEYKIKREDVINVRKKILENCDQVIIEEIKEALREEPKAINTTTNVNLVEKFKNISNVSKKVVGQDFAIAKVKNGILSSLVGFKDEKQPIASFLLTGPTGVGKTETAKAVADACFDGKIYVIDMATYKNDIDVSRLLGGSPNYVGYNDPNTFCNFLKENPNSVILFDEIEKGHPDCLDLLMRILDEGEFINAKGETISLKDTVIFCTTNFTQNSKNIVGFGNDVSTEQKMTTNGIGLKKELVGRFTDVIEYKQLSKESCSKLAKTFLTHAINNFDKNNQMNIRLLYSSELIDKIIKDADTNMFGARDLKKSIRKNFIAPVSNYLSKYSELKNATLVVDCEGVKQIDLLEKTNQITDFTPIKREKHKQK